MLHVEERAVLEQRQRLIAQKRENYRQMHEGTAKAKNVYKEFMNAKTLTQMRKLLW